MKIAVVNAGRLDWDGALSFQALEACGEVVCFAESSPTPAEIALHAGGATVLVTKEVPVDVSLLPASVRLICEAGTGYNNHDVVACAARGVVVCNVPSYSSDAVAQLVLTCMLSFSASLTQQHRALARGDKTLFGGAFPLPLFELRGKTLGLVGGNGEIGSRVSTLAQALGMKVLVYSRSSATPLATLLSESDFISLHCPLTPATKHLINASALSGMKKSAYLINTARGAIVDEAALVAALQAGRLAGAALDVQDPEPPAADSPLYTLDNVILTPHIGWKRAETRQRLIDAVASNIAVWAAGKPVSVVTPPAGP